MRPSTVGSFVGGAQVKYPQVPASPAIKWHKRGKNSSAWQTCNVGKAILSFPGFIVQPAIIAGIDRDESCGRI